MLTNTVRKALGRKKYLAMAIPLLMAAQAQGVEFNIGQIEGSFDSQLSLGSSWRVEGRDANLLTGIQDETTNGDDSNKNYASGDAFSQIFKGSHELQFSYQNYGGFVRGKYWYDSALANNSVDYGHGPTTTVGGITGTGIAYNNPNQKLDDSDFSDLSKASGVALLDAFVYGEFDVLDMPLDLRLGKQVVSWGESTFIVGGINAINPFDVNAFLRPGAEIKEFLLPVNMAYANIGLTENLSAEAFYQLEFEGHALPGCGTYFSSLDFDGTGDCNRVIILDGLASVGRGVDGNREAKDDGQFGVAFRFVSEALGDTEFGLYFMNIHDRAPIFNMIKNNVDEAQIGADAYVPGAVADLTARVEAGEFGADYLTDAAYLAVAATIPVGTNEAGLAAAQFAGLAAVVADSGYYMAYQEDTQLVGLSFATNVGSMALSGEITHKMDVPLQINGQQLVAAALGGNVAEAYANELDLLVYAADEGAEIAGFRRFDVTQAQVTAIKFFDQVAGASRITFVGEAGMTFVHSFDESADAIKFGRSGIFGQPHLTDNDGFTTESSWGYRMQISADYADVFAGINLKPVLSWSDDVKGYSPQPAGAFQEGQQSLGLSLQADYMSTYSAAISLTQYMGGDYSVVSDRDFASISVGMQF